MGVKTYQKVGSNKKKALKNLISNHLNNLLPLDTILRAFSTKAPELSSSSIHLEMRYKYHRGTKGAHFEI